MSLCPDTVPCAVTMDKAWEIKAVFVGDYTLKVINKSKKVNKVGGSGTVTYAPAGISCVTGSTTNCSGKVPYHTTIVLTATPDAGSAVKWAGCPTPSGDTCSLTMDKAYTVTATFKPSGAGVGLEEEE